jgi:hypothetical protein
MTNTEDREPDVIPSDAVGLREYVRERNTPPPEPVERTDLKDAGVSEEKGVSLREATRITSDARDKRLAQEEVERRAYAKAAGLESEPRELPNLDASDAELTREELSSFAKSCSGFSKTTLKPTSGFRPNRRNKRKRSSRITRRTIKTCRT